MFINRKSSKRFLMHFVDGERSEGGQRRLLPLQSTKGILQKIMPKVDAEGGGGVGEVNQKKRPCWLENRFKLVTNYGEKVKKCSSKKGK